MKQDLSGAYSDTDKGLSRLMTLWAFARAIGIGLVLLVWILAGALWTRISKE